MPGFYRNSFETFLRAQKRRFQHENEVMQDDYDIIHEKRPRCEMLECNGGFVDDEHAAMDTDIDSTRSVEPLNNNCTDFAAAPNAHADKPMDLLDEVYTTSVLPPVQPSQASKIISETRANNVRMYCPQVDSVYGYGCQYYFSDYY